MEMPDFENLGGDGGNFKVSDALLAEIKDEVEFLATEETAQLWRSRLDSDETRYCVWPSQNADSRKHTAAGDLEAVKPFEGACDQRVRYADMVTNEKVMLVVLASLRATIGIKGVEGTDSAKANKLEILRRWLINNELGFDYVRELIKLANFVFGDSPGVGLMAIQWRRERGLRMRELSLEELQALYVELQMETMAGAGGDVSEEEQQLQYESAAQDFAEAFSNPAFTNEQLAPMVLSFFPHLSKARSKKVVKDLRAPSEDGVAKAFFPEPYVKKDGPEIRAKRLNQDFYVPQNAGEFQRVRMWFEPVWLDKTEVYERQVSEGWSRAFVNALVGEDADDAGKEAMAAFPEYEMSASGEPVQVDQKYYRGMYQVVYVNLKTVNGDNVPGRYHTVIHREIESAAHDLRLIDAWHGKWLGHVVQREVLTDRMVDSRGIPELASSYQDMLKLFGDSWGDNAQISGVPPIVTRGRKSSGQLYLGPMEELQARREGDFKWLSPPEYPRSIDSMIDLQKSHGDEYFGRANPNVPDSNKQLNDEFTVIWWLVNLVEIHKQIIMLGQQYMTPEKLDRITNNEGQPLFANMEELQGGFDMAMSFDVRDFDPDFLEKLGGIIKDTLVVMDTNKTIDTTPIVSMLLYRLSPSMADAALRSVEHASELELDDELKQFTQILAGREPERVTNGTINYGLRLRWYEDTKAQNPMAFENMPEDQYAVLGARLEFLEAQDRQFGENAQVGREGAGRALGN